MAGRLTPKGGPLTLTQLEYYWVQGGGPPSVAPVAAAIALAESSGENVIQQGQPYSTTGWGLWQITPGNSESQFGTDNALLDPLTNAKAAVAKYNAAGHSFQPWTTYNTGAYKQYLKKGSVIPGYLLIGGLGAALGGAAAAAAGAEGVIGGAEAGGAGGAATGGAAATASGLSTLAKIKSGLGAAALISVLLDPKHWLRILMVVGGAVLVFLALVYMLKSQLMKAA